MSGHDEQPEQDPAGTDADGLREDGQLTEASTHRMIKRLNGGIQNLQAELDQIKENTHTGGPAAPGAGREAPAGGQQSLHGAGVESGSDGDGEPPGELPEWCWFPPPPEPAEPDPRASLEGFVDWFNTIYVEVGAKGINGHIPACWRDHPAVVAEVATLAAAWRAAFLAPEASARDAQYWHHTWRPGFAQRLQAWLGDECRRDRHEPGTAAPRTDIGADPKPDRWTETATTTVARSAGAARSHGALGA